MTKDEIIKEKDVQIEQLKKDLKKQIAYSFEVDGKLRRLNNAIDFIRDAIDGMR